MGICMDWKIIGITVNSVSEVTFSPEYSPAWQHDAISKLKISCILLLISCLSRQSALTFVGI